MEMMDMHELSEMYQKGDITDEFILFHFGQEVLERLVHILTDPFNDVLGG